MAATRQRTPSASTAADSVGVGLVDHQRADALGVPPGHPHHRGLVPELAHEPVGRALEGGAGDDGRDADDPFAGRPQPVAHSRHGQDRTDRHDRVGRADDDHLGGVDGPEHAGRRPGLIGAVEADIGDGHVVAEPDEVLLEADLGPVGQPEVGADGIVAHRDDAHPDTPRPAQLGRDLVQGGPLGQALGAVAVGGEVAVAEPEPGEAAQPSRATP